MTPELREHHFYLILLTNENTIYYTLLRQSDDHPQLGLSRLIGRRNCHASYLLFYCLQPFLTSERRDEHMKVCATMGLRTIVFPKRKSWKFDSWKNTMRISYYLAADFESVLEKVERQACRNMGTCQR